MAVGRKTSRTRQKSLIAGAWKPRGIRERTDRSERIAAHEDVPSRYCTRTTWDVAYLWEPMSLGAGRPPSQFGDA